MHLNKVSPLIEKPNEGSSKDISRMDGNTQPNFGYPMNGFSTDFEKSQFQQAGSKKMIERQPTHKSYESFKNSLKGQTLSNTNIFHPKLNTQKSRLAVFPKVPSRESSVVKSSIVGGAQTMFLTSAEKNTSDSETARLQNIKNNIFKVLEDKTPEEIQAKALRHFEDAHQLRKPRNVFDKTDNKFGKIFIKFYGLRQSSYWKLLQTIFSYMFLVQTFLEPQSLADSFDDSFEQYVYSSEIIILIFSFLDNALALLALKSNHKNKFFNFIALLSSFTLVFTFFADFLIFWHFQSFGIRFSSVLRPFWFIQFQDDIYKALKSIVLSFKQVIDIFLFFIALSAFFGYMGYNLFSEYATQFEDDKYFVFGTVGKSMVGMYTLISMDTYPSILRGIVLDNVYYLIFFLPFIAINLFFLLFIPVAVIFENYKKQRAKIILQDEIIIHEALTYCFFCLQYLNEQEFLTRDQFFELINQYFRGRALRDKIDEIYSILNVDIQEKMSLNEFKDVQDLMMSSERLFDNSNIYWDYFRYFCNRYFRFEQIGSSHQWNYFILFIVTVNTTLVFVYTFLPASSDNQTTEIDDWMTNIDMVFNVIYIIDVAIKMIGFGIEVYFKNSWNNFDFFMVCVSIITIFGLNYIYFLKKAKSTKLLKLTKIQKVLKIFRSLRSLKLFKILKLGADALIRVQKLFHKVALCVPSLYGLLKAYFLFSFSYAIIGTYIFNTDYNSYRSNSPYLENDFTDFNNLQGALLALFQVITQSRWADYVYGYGYQFDITSSTLYFCFYHMFSILFFMSLLQGIVWEVFGVVEEYFRQHEIEEQNHHHEIEEKAISEQGEGCNNLDFQNQEEQQFCDNSASITEMPSQEIKGLFRTRGGIKIAEEDKKHDVSMIKEYLVPLNQLKVVTEVELATEDIDLKKSSQLIKSNNDNNIDSNHDLIKNATNLTQYEFRSNYSHNGGVKEEEEQYEAGSISENETKCHKKNSKNLLVSNDEEVNKQVYIPLNKAKKKFQENKEKSDSESQQSSQLYKSPTNNFLISSSSSDKLLLKEIAHNQSKNKNDENHFSSKFELEKKKINNFSLEQPTESININQNSQNLLKKKADDLSNKTDPSTSTTVKKPKKKSTSKMQVELEINKSPKLEGIRIESQEFDNTDNLLVLDDYQSVTHLIIPNLAKQNHSEDQTEAATVTQISPIKKQELNQKNVSTKIPKLLPFIQSSVTPLNSPPPTPNAMPSAVKKVLGILKKNDDTQRENRFGGGRLTIHLNELDKYFQKRVQIVRYQIDLLKQLNQLEKFLQLHDQTGLQQTELRKERIMKKHKCMNLFTISKQHALQKMTYLKDHPQNVNYGSKHQYLTNTELMLGYSSIPLTNKLRDQKKDTKNHQSINSAGSLGSPKENKKDNQQKNGIKLEREKHESSDDCSISDLIDENNISSSSEQENKEDKHNARVGSADINDQTFLRLNNIFSFLLHLLTNIQQIDNQVLIQKLFVIEQSINQVIFKDYDESQPLNHFKFVFGAPLEGQYLVLIKQYDIYDSQNLFGSQYAEHHQNILQQQQNSQAVSHSVIEVKTISGDGSPWSSFTKAFKFEKTIYLIRSLFESTYKATDKQIAQKISTSMQYMRGYEFCLEDLTQNVTELYASFILSKSSDNIIQPVTSASQLPFISFICNRTTGEQANKQPRQLSVLNPARNMNVNISEQSKLRNKSEPQKRRKKQNNFEENGGYSKLTQENQENFKQISKALTQIQEVPLQKEYSKNESTLIQQQLIKEQNPNQLEKVEENGEELQNPLDKLKRTKSPFQLSNSTQKFSLKQKQQDKDKQEISQQKDKKLSIVPFSEREIQINRKSGAQKRTSMFPFSLRKKASLDYQQEHVIKIYSQIQQFFYTHSHLISGVIQRLQGHVTAQIPCYIEMDKVDQKNLHAS